MSKRRILLVDDEIAVLLTLKTVLEISGYDVDTATSARDARHKLKVHTYDMVITDMRMESDQAGKEVIAYARTAEYHPAVALLTAFPDASDDWQDMGADKMLVKPMQTRSLIQSIEKMLAAHDEKIRKLGEGGVSAGLAAGFAAGMAAGRTGMSLEASSAPAAAKPGKRNKAAGSPAKASGKRAVKVAAKKTVEKKAAAARKQ